MKPKIEITLSRYGLFDGVENIERLDQDATMKKMVAAARRKLRGLYPDNEVAVAFHTDETSSNSIQITGIADPYAEQEVRERLTEIVDSEGLFDYSAESLWVWLRPVARLIYAPGESTPVGKAEWQLCPPDKRITASEREAASAVIGQGLYYPDVAGYYQALSAAKQLGWDVVVLRKNRWYVVDTLEWQQPTSPRRPVEWDD